MCKSCLLSSLFFIAPWALCRVDLAHYKSYELLLLLLLHPPVGDYRITRESSCQRCARLPAADHKHVQGNGFDAQHGDAMDVNAQGV